MSFIKSSIAALMALAALWSAAPAAALDFVQPGGPYSVAAESIQSLAVGDLNGDGRDDVVTANYNPSSFSVALTNSDGTLATPVNYTDPMIPYSVAVGDLDNDGDLDVVTAGNDKVAVSLGNGDGTFGAATEMANPGYSGIAVEVGNFNSGGNLDVVVGDYTGNKVGLLLGNGAGSLVQQGQAATGLNPTGITVGDFDGNGIDDFATANYGSFFTGAITVALGSASGTFSSGPGSPLEGDYQPRDIAAGDFNDDGDLDLGVVNSPNQAMSVKIGDGSGAFADAPSLPSIPSHWGESIGSADFNGDGFDDLAVTWDDSIGVFLGSATGVMTPSPDGPWQTTSPASAWFLETGNFNNDNRPDFVVADLNNRVSVFVNVARELTAAPTAIHFGDREINSGPSASQGADFTNTGTASVAVPAGGVSVAGSDAGQFQIVSEDCEQTSISVSAHCTVTVAFSPTSAGPKTATLQVSSDADGSPTQVDLDGTGTTVPRATIAPASHDFGQVRLGTGPAAAQEFEVESTGTAALDVAGVGLTGADALDFSIVSDGCSGEILEPEQSCAIAVDFEPGALGARTASLSLASDAPGSPTAIPLTGEGIANPNFTLTPASQDFGTRLVDDGPGESKAFNLTSTGTTDLKAGAVTLTGTAATQFQITSEDCTNQTLAPESACRVEVAFAPTSAGEKTAALSIGLEAGAGTATAQLTGSGQAPIPPPDPCQPVAVKKIAYFTPKVKKRSNIPGLRARLTTAGPAVVRISSKVVYHLNGRQGKIKYKQRQFQVPAGALNYKVAIPKKLRSKLKPKKQVRFVISYASKANKPECTKFGPKKTRNLTTRVVWVIPNA